jgi:hypothetical protein
MRTCTYPGKIFKTASVEYRQLGVSSEFFDRSVFKRFVMVLNIFFAELNRPCTCLLINLKVTRRPL